MDWQTSIKTKERSYSRYKRNDKQAYIFPFFYLLQLLQALWSYVSSYTEWYIKLSLSLTLDLNSSTTINIEWALVLIPSHYKAYLKGLLESGDYSLGCLVIVTHTLQVILSSLRFCIPLLSALFVEITICRSSDSYKSFLTSALHHHSISTTTRRKTMNYSAILVICLLSITFALGQESK